MATASEKNPIISENPKSNKQEQPKISPEEDAQNQDPRSNKEKGPVQILGSQKLGDKDLETFDFLK